jgi:hypothetical protein
VGAARFAADVCLYLLEGGRTPRTQLEMVRKRPLPFPPEPFASLGIQANRRGGVVFEGCNTAAGSGDGQVTVQGAGGDLRGTDVIVDHRSERSTTSR